MHMAYMNFKNAFYFLALAGLLSGALTACETTGTSPGKTGQSSAQIEKGETRDAIDRVLARNSAGQNANGNRVGSLYVVERAYKRNPDDISAAIDYARALRNEGLGRRGLMILKPHLTTNPDNTEALIEFAASNLAIGRYQEAESAARKAVVANPEKHRAYHVLGVALDAQGFHKQAEVAFRRGLEHWEGDPVPILNNLALSLAAQGYLDNSLSILRRAAASAPNRNEIERNLRIITALHDNMQGRATQAATQKPESRLSKLPPVPSNKPD